MVKRFVTIFIALFLVMSGTVSAQTTGPNFFFPVGSTTYAYAAQQICPPPTFNCYIPAVAYDFNRWLINGVWYVDIFVSLDWGGVWAPIAEVRYRSTHQVSNWTGGESIGIISGPLPAPWFTTKAIGVAFPRSPQGEPFNAGNNWKISHFQGLGFEMHNLDWFNGIFISSNGSPYDIIVDQMWANSMGFVQYHCRVEFICASPDVN